MQNCARGQGCLYQTEEEGPGSRGSGGRSLSDVKKASAQEWEKFLEAGNEQKRGALQRLSRRDTVPQAFCL